MVHTPHGFRITNVRFVHFEQTAVKETFYEWN